MISQRLSRFPLSCLTGRGLRLFGIRNSSRNASTENSKFIFLHCIKSTWFFIFTCSTTHRSLNTLRQALFILLNFQSTCYSYPLVMCNIVLKAIISVTILLTQKAQILIHVFAFSCCAKINLGCEFFLKSNGCCSVLFITIVISS